MSLRQDLKSKTSKKSKSTQSESKATKKPAVIKELEKHFDKPEITVQCVVEMSKENDPFLAMKIVQVPLSKRDAIYGP